MALKLITAPATYPVTVAELKSHLRIEQVYTDEDTQIEEYLKAAIVHVDGYQGILRGRCLESQVWEITYDEFPSDGGPIKSQLCPLISVDSVKYDDPDGVEQTLAADQYEVDLISLDQWIVPALGGSWPSTYQGINAVRIRVTAGYAQASGASTVPDPIKSGIKLIAEHLYNRNAGPFASGIYALLDPWRNYSKGD